MSRLERRGGLTRAKARSKVIRGEMKKSCRKGNDSSSQLPLLLDDEWGIVVVVGLVRFREKIT